MHTVKCQAGEEHKTGERNTKHNILIEVIGLTLHSKSAPNITLS